MSGFRYTGRLRPVPVYRTETTRIGAIGITAAYRQPYAGQPTPGVDESRLGLPVLCRYTVAARDGKLDL